MTNVYATPPRPRRGRSRRPKELEDSPLLQDNVCQLKANKCRLYFPSDGADNGAVAQVSVTVHWRIRQPVNLLDWIGLYELGKRRRQMTAVPWD